MNTRALFVVVAVAIAPAAAFGPGDRLVSPNRAYALIGSANAVQLWMEETRTHQRRMVLDNVTLPTMSLAWAPDSAAFAVSDRFASDVELAYIYDVKTLDRLELRPRILAAYRDAARFVPGPDTAPHSYCHVMRWLDARHVEVRLHGHTDGVRIGTSIRPGDCFDLRFRVSRDGEVEKLSRRVLPISNSNGCAAIGD